MVFVCRFLVFLVAGGALAQDVRIVEQIVAKVNGEILTTSELERVRRQMEAELRRQGLSGAEFEKALKELEKNLLRDRVDQMLLVQRGDDLNINVDNEVTKYLGDIQLRNKIADQDKFQQWIREQSNMPFEDFKAELNDGILTQRVIGQEVSSKISIPRSEVIKYYEGHKDEFVREERVFLAEILVSTQGKTPEEIPALEKKAKELVERARAGERFSDLVRDHSDSPSARDSGQVGAFKRADLNQQIADVVFSNEKNYVTDPIRVPNGFLILQVLERHKAGLAQMEEVENEIMDKLYRPLFDPALRDYLTQLRQQAFLQIRDGYIDSAAAAGKDTSWQDPAQLKPETVTREEVLTKTRRRRLLWLLPVPGTKVKATSKSGN
jgi:parvulin-like peptidyl-prolyl isomerase